MNTTNISISVIIPCLNEASSIACCVTKALAALKQMNRSGEVLVVDNGSTDGSAQIATEAGARVVCQPVRGYGAAYIKGISEAQGECVVLGDGDDTSNFADIPLLIKHLDDGADFVIGSRFKGTIMRGAMSWSHRYVGNPILCGILNFLFRSSLSDSHSGFRALKKSSVDKLRLHTSGMEFASEMIVMALRHKLKIVEVPITYWPRQGISKLSSFSDAWRHMRFMLLFSPNWIFCIPGLVLFLGGLGAFALAGFGLLSISGHVYDVHAMIFFTLFTLIGFEILTLWLYAKAFSYKEGFERADIFCHRPLKWITLEAGLCIGAILFAAGAFGSVNIFVSWLKTNDVGPFDEIKRCLASLLSMVIGLQVIFSSFFLSLLRIPRLTSK